MVPCLEETKSCWGMRSDETHTRDSFFHLPCYTREVYRLPLTKRASRPAGRPAVSVRLSCVGD